MCRVNMDALFGAPIDPVASSSKAAAAVASASIDEQRQAYDRLPSDGWDIFKSLVSTEKKCQMLHTRMQDVMGMMTTLFDGFCVCHGDGSIVTHLPTLETYIGGGALCAGGNITDLAANAEEKQRLRAFCCNVNTNLKIDVTLQTSQGNALDATLFASMLSPGGGIALGDFILGFQFSFAMQDVDNSMNQVEEASQSADSGACNDVDFDSPTSSQRRWRQDRSWITSPACAWPVEVEETALVSRSTITKNTFIHCSRSEAGEDESEDKTGRSSSAPPKMREMPAKRRSSPLKFRTVVSKMVKVMNVVKIWSNCHRDGERCACVLKVNQSSQSASQDGIVGDDVIVKMKSWPQVGNYGEFGPSKLLSNYVVKNTFIHLNGESQVVEGSRQRASSAPPRKPELLESQDAPFAFNSSDVDPETSSVRGGSHSYCDGTCSSAWQSSAASVVSDDVQITLGNRVRDRNLMTEGLCEDRLPVAQLTPMLLARHNGLRSIGSFNHCTGDCYPCLMEAWHRTGKSPQPCKFGSLCGRCHENHSHADVRKLKRHMSKK